MPPAANSRKFGRKRRSLSIATEIEACRICQRLAHGLPEHDGRSGARHSVATNRTFTDSALRREAPCLHVLAFPDRRRPAAGELFDYMGPVSRNLVEDAMRKTTTTIVAAASIAATAIATPKPAEARC